MTLILKKVGSGGLLFIFLFSSFNIPAFSADESTQVSSMHISSKEFLASPFAKFFKEHKYQEALKAIEQLSNQYPDDPLILRYRALTLEKLGRRKEAVAIYQKLLAQDPEHAPTRIALGRAYRHQGKREAAAQEFRKASLHSKKQIYQKWAQTELNRMRLGVKKPSKRKRFYFVGKTGMNYDSNPLLLPNDKSLIRPGTKKEGIDYLMNWTAGYAPLLRRDSRIDLLYIGQETLHNGRADRVNFHSEGFAVDTKKRKIFWNRAFLFGGRYDFKANFLTDNLFSVSNRFYLSAATSFVKRTKTQFFGRFNVLNFGKDGSDPSQTSRDGFRTGIGITQYFYTADLKRFFFVKEELNLNEARGENLDRRGVLSRIGIHTPVDFIKKMDWDTSAGFDYGEYHDFDSLSTLNTERRQNARWDMYTALTYHWTKRFATRAFYRFIKSNNRNNFFDRDRHLAGGEVIFGL